MYATNVVDDNLGIARDGGGATVRKEARGSDFIRDRYIPFIRSMQSGRIKM